MPPYGGDFFSLSFFVTPTIRYWLSGALVKQTTIVQMHHRYLVPVKILNMRKLYAASMKSGVKKL